MKGVIADCVADLVKSAYGDETWQEILEESGIGRGRRFLVIEDVEDAQIMKLVQTICQKLGANVQTVADLFGDHWVNVYSPRIYGAYYDSAKNAREFLLAMDRVHTEMTARMAQAHPPRFTYEWTDPDTLEMNYQSSRNLIEFVAGLARGVGKHYGENLAVTTHGRTAVTVKFPPAPAA